MPKKTKKKPSVLSRLRLNTARGKLVIFIVAFAVLGGGYFAYKSFAATPYTVRAADFSKQKNFYTKGQVEYRPNAINFKGGVPAYYIVDDRNRTDGRTGFTWFKATLFEKGYYRVCAYGRAIEGPAEIRLSAKLSHINGQKGYWGTSSSFNQKTCVDTDWRVSGPSNQPDIVFTAVDGQVELSGITFLKIAD